MFVEDLKILINRGKQGTGEVSRYICVRNRDMILITALKGLPRIFAEFSTSVNFACSASKVLSHYYRVGHAKGEE
jgi:hypothetical protein